MTSETRGWLLYFFAVPCLFAAILFVWNAIDTYLGSREVSRFIRDHEKLVAGRLTNPKVHSFRLLHDPTDAGTLMIEFDVDDKATYELLEKDLLAASSLRFPAVWQTKLRSGEDLGMDLGAAAEGIGRAVSGAGRLFIALVASLAIPGIVPAVILPWMRRKKRTTARRGWEEPGENLWL